MNWDNTALSPILQYIQGQNNNPYIQAKCMVTLQEGPSLHSFDHKCLVTAPLILFDQEEEKQFGVPNCHHDDWMQLTHIARKAKLFCVTKILFELHFLSVLETELIIHKSGMNEEKIVWKKISGFILRKAIMVLLHSKTLWATTG
jgi:hypothetical protein